MSGVSGEQISSEIAMLLDCLQRAWNSRNPELLSLLYDENAIITNPTGSLVGIDTIVGSFAQLCREDEDCMGYVQVMGVHPIAFPQESDGTRKIRARVFAKFLASDLESVIDYQMQLFLERSADGRIKILQEVAAPLFEANQ